MSGPSTKLSATKWKPAVSRGLGDGEVAAALKVTVLSTSILPKVVAASIA